MAARLVGVVAPARYFESTAERRDGRIAHMTTRRSVELHGGPLDGETVPIDADDPDPGAALISGGCQYLGGRSWYEPDDTGLWRWTGDTP